VRLFRRAVRTGMAWLVACRTALVKVVVAWSRSLVEFMDVSGLSVESKMLLNRGQLACR
jgi:hypothetical protein